MCGRYVLFTTDETLLSAAAAVARVESVAAPQGTPPPRYNIAPTHSIPVIVTEPGDSPAPMPAQVSLRAARWGLVPSWKKDLTGPTLFNARAETIAEKPSFRGAYRRTRCLIPMDGYYEWSGGQPYMVRREDGELLWVAGIVDTGCDMLSASVVTTASHAPVEWLHHRMPLILGTEASRAWISPDVRQADAIVQSAPDQGVRERLCTTAVDPAVGKVGNDYPELLQPREGETGGDR